MNTKVIRIMKLMLVSLGIVSAQNFSYVDGDWDIKTSPNIINAMAESTWDIFIATDNGIYVWDKMNESITYAFTLTYYLRSKNIYHLYYDLNTDFFWAVHENGISYKPAVGTFWTDTSLPIIPSRVSDIGSTDGIVWFDYQGKYISVDAFTGVEVVPDEFANTDFIQWGYSRFGRAGDNLETINNTFDDEFTDENREYALYNPVRTTMKMPDSKGNYWVGTNKGYVFLQGRHSSRGEKIYLGTPNTEVTTLYYDRDQNWWMGDNRFKRMGHKSKLIREEKFLYKWNEMNDHWTEYSTKYLDLIHDTNINCILRVKYYLYVGTLEGLLILNIADDEWDIISEGLLDPSVWDMVEKDGKLYLATAKGVQVLSIPENELDVNQPEFLNDLRGSEIFDLDIKDQDLFVAANSGVYRINLAKEKSKKITSQSFKSLSAQGDQLILANDGLWKVKKGDQLEQFYFDDVFKFTVSGKFVWITTGKEAILFDMKNERETSYSADDGIPGSVIYEINCDDNWVWFGTNNGIAIYNWSRYHK
ncbi:MAG: hypothetical protein HQ510_07840 [Candidatus Marinimicrobia bacterium]|nr:hypothetical protein [Candidatus Neomarinimicrobiota bacterium]